MEERFETKITGQNGDERESRKKGDTDILRRKRASTTNSDRRFKKKAGGNVGVCVRPGGIQGPQGPKDSNANPGMKIKKKRRRRKKEDTEGNSQRSKGEKKKKSGHNVRTTS